MSENWNKGRFQNFKIGPNGQRLARMQLPTLEKRWERGDIIALYRLVNGMEQLHREDLFVFSEIDTRGHWRKLRSIYHLFPAQNRSWNGLEGEVHGVC